MISPKREKSLYGNCRPYQGYKRPHKEKSDDSAPKEITLEEQFAAAQKPDPTPSTSSSQIDNPLSSLTDRERDEIFIKLMLIEQFGPEAELGNGSDNPKRELYERAVLNGDPDFLWAAYARKYAAIALRNSEDAKEQYYQPPRLHSHPQGDAIVSTAYHLEKAERLFANRQYEEGFLEAEEALLSTDVKLFWYRLVSLMSVQYKQISPSGIPGKLGEEVRRYADLPYVSEKEYRSGIFCSLLFTAAMLYFLWCPPLRDFLVTTIQSDYFLYVCVVIVFILFFIASWAGAIAGLIILGVLGGATEHFFGEAAHSTTLIVLIYLAGCAILFTLAKNTGYSKVKRNKKHKKINKQRAEMRRELEPQLRQRLAKLDQIEQATKLDSNNTPSVLYWAAHSYVYSAEDYRKSFPDELATLRELYQKALNSL